jgi:predicted GTPase
VRTLLRMARAAYTDPLERHRIDDLEARLDEPLRVAIAGKVKAGKSTLLNGLVGEELAPTDASECTRIVTWYVNGQNYAATLHLEGGSEVSTAFSRQSGAIDVDLQGQPAERVDHIVVEWPSSSLTELSLIDTPGIASISTDLSARTHRFVLAEADHESKADAVVYLMRHLHPTDIRFLESFQDQQAGRTNPINAIGVLSRADELAGGQDDALESAVKVAARYRSSPQVRRLCQTVVPVAGLLAQASATLRQSEYNLLARLAGLPDVQLDLLLASADRFVDNDLVANVVANDREQLIRRLGLFGVRRAVHAVRTGLVADAPALAQYLFEQSGLAELRRILMSQFAARRDVLKAQAALQALAHRLRVAPPPSGADQLQFELEKLRSTAHVFAEIQLFAAIRAGAVPFTDAEVDGVERLLGAEGYAPTVRLGLPDDATAEQIRDVLNDRIRAWRSRAENPLSSRELSDAAQVLVRTCEGMLRVMQVV